MPVGTLDEIRRIHGGVRCPKCDRWHFPREGNPLCGACEAGVPR